MKRKNLAIGCGLTSVLFGLVMFVMIVLAAKGCEGCVSGGPYGMVREAAASDARITEALGGVVSVSPMPSGSINYMNGEGQADLSLPIDGVDKDAEYVTAVRKPRGATEWEIVTAQLILDDGTVVVLDPPVQ